MAVLGGGGGGGRVGHGPGPRAFLLSGGPAHRLQNNLSCFRAFRSHASFLFPDFILFPYFILLKVCIAFFRYKIHNLADK